ncbi:hypothetical protein [Streptomyces sp. NPDC058394]|uniref:hypothetical protein n=1 Tax=Streptomyces sp. NPDC058394 TaxID=3346477 RepID=UPI0036519362
MKAIEAPEEFEVPPEQALLVVDIKNYSQLPEAKMAAVRSDLGDILDTVFVQSALPNLQSLGDAYKDTGDGAIIVLPARHTARLVDPLLGHLNDALARYDKMRLASAPPIRLRASVHVGPLTPEHRGDAINEACRLVDSDRARQAMTAAEDNGAFLATAISDAAFRCTVRAGRTPDLKERQFLRATAHVKGKPGFEESCWLLAPTVAPAVISPYLADEDDELPPPLQDSAGHDGAKREKPDGRQASVRQKGKASGKARLVQVGGNYITGPERS